jgi:hypothetical protein
MSERLMLGDVQGENRRACEIRFGMRRSDAGEEKRQQLLSIHAKAERKRKDGTSLRH